MRPLVHIGYHKTATTWFQTRFYPAVRNARFVPRAAVRAILIDPTAFAFDPRRARRALVTGGGGPILCEEGLSGYLHNGGLAGHLSKEMAWRLRRTLPDARIVIFLRSQPAMIAAAYQQYVKGGGTYSLRRYLFPRQHATGALAETSKAPRFQFDHFDYDRLVRHYRKTFGPANVHIFLYEDFRRDRGDFLRRYAAELDLDVALDEAAMAPVYRSYNRPALWASRLLGHFTARTVADKHWFVHLPLLYPAMRALSEGLSRLPIAQPSPVSLLGADLHDWIGHRFAESNRRLVADTGLPLEAFGYPLDGGDRRYRAPPVRRRLPRWMDI